jgi:hypothetical protein
MPDPRRVVQVCVLYDNGESELFDDVDARYRVRRNYRQLIPGSRRAEPYDEHEVVWNVEPGGPLGYEDMS